jgi:hypothetical protein
MWPNYGLVQPADNLPVFVLRISFKRGGSYISIGCEFQYEAGQLLIRRHLNDQDKIDRPLRQIHRPDVATHVFGEFPRRIQPLG